jgi:tRNA modification GTPase
MSIYNQSLLNDDSCIAAIATGMTDAGIGIIRVSGKDSVKLVDSFLPDIDLSSCKSHTINYGHFQFNGDVIDEVMVSLFLAPKSYTRENVVEINCHGGMLILEEVLNALFTSDIRPAEPGEFTKRAFLNGRIDLSQSEAVMDLINSSNDFSRKSSMMHLNGNLSKKVKSYRDAILHECAYIESALDDPEHYSLDGYSDELRIKLSNLLSEMEDMSNNFNEGSVLTHGIDTAIVGRPNVGKSSLLNLLSGEDYAIVTDIPGTTRDVISNSINFRGLPLNLFDTAGIRDTDNVVEKIGVEKSLSYINKADLILFLLDSSCEFSEEDREIYERIEDSKASFLTILNKSDLDNKLDLEGLPNKLKSNYISISVSEESGIEDLADAIKNLFFTGKLIDPSESLISNKRQLFELNTAIKSLSLCINSIDMGMTEDVFTIDLMDAYSALGRIVGESVEDDLVDRIFSEFCMGK